MSDTPLTDAVVRSRGEVRDAALYDFSRKLEHVYNSARAVLCNVDKMANDQRFDALREACREVTKENNNGKD